MPTGNRDLEGIQSGRATLPSDDDTRCHDTIGRELFSIIHAAGLRTKLSPTHIFDSLVVEVGPAVLESPRSKGGVE